MGDFLFCVNLCGFLLIFLDIPGTLTAQEKAIPRISEECLLFEVYPEHSLYGYNNHIVNDVYLEDCNTLCARQTLFLCASYEYNKDSRTCYLSAEDMYTQSRAFGENPNTDYYQRYCSDRTLLTSAHSTATTAGTSAPAITTAPSTIVTRDSPKVVSSTTTHVMGSGTRPSVEEPSAGDGDPSVIVPEFYGASYLELTRPNLIYRMCEVTIEINTGVENGLILYLGDGEVDFLSLAMIDGYLEFRYDTGSGKAILKSREPLELNQTHLIVASRLNRSGRLLIDDQQEVTGDSVGGSSSLNINSNVFLGFVPAEFYDLMIQQTEALLGIAGCIQSLQIEGLGSRLIYDLSFPTSEDVITSNGVGVCGGVQPEVTACDLHPCHHGTCVPGQPDGYECVCELGYTGPTCEGLLIIDVLDHVQVNRNESITAWINCIGRSTLDTGDWTIKWYQNDTEIQESTKDAPDYNFVQTEYETDLLGAERLFVAQLYFPHITPQNRIQLNGNYTCEVVTSLEPVMQKTLQVIF